MSKSIMNLTIRLVIAEIEQVLGTYPHHPYQQVFANPDIRQELIAFVLTRIHNVYAAVEEEERISGDIETISDSEEVEAYLEAFIRQGIDDILKQHPEFVEHQVPEETNGYMTSSHWFG